jgi:hypothetical protein
MAIHGEQGEASTSVGGLPHGSGIMSLFCAHLFIVAVCLLVSPHCCRER